jgi:hypothetical protein
MLTERQKYLLDRIPRIYDLNGRKPILIPPDVKRARALVERWDKAESKRACAAKKRNEALLRKAREAVYFCDERKALAIVQQCEKLLKGCEE